MWHPKVYVSPDKGFLKSPKLADVDTHIQAVSSKRRNENEERSVLMSGLFEQMQLMQMHLRTSRPRTGLNCPTWLEAMRLQDEVRRYERAERC